MQPRQIAICVFRHGNRILAAPAYDDTTKERFFRPLGGAIEAGETPAEALHREVQEETGLKITYLVQLGVIDNRFEYRGHRGHETVFVFDASFVDPRAYSMDAIRMFEPGRTRPAEWLGLEDPLPAPLYPKGLLELLKTAV